ncbi:guanylate-binding protein 7-like [Clarias gariepinus]|uniref:guanylate-binding protein 1-like n=1 Tax=Clarias gariepinus TaxID=13013 RepID=UPI00234DAD99|nr:guanylate-binding protein 1-like [Clarias gariepinus]
MEKPECLISTDSEGRLYVVKEAQKILERISQPVVVVSIVGLYRTGKSYLMNHLAGQQTGFALGSTIESTTKGIWMWCVPHPTNPGYTLVLLDTEGLGDVDKGDEKHDTWMFCLAVLLSSTLVYNSLGVIDNNALEKLHYVTELTEHIQVKAQTGDDHDNSAEFMRYFPSFIWAVRDFMLKLEKEGKAITANEYLELALKFKSGVSASVDKFNLPRRYLRSFFAERRCFVFPRPTRDDDDLIRMEELTENDLNPRFLKHTKEFCSYVFSNAKPKTLARGQTLTGSALGSLAEIYVEAIRSGEVPCLESAVETLAKIQNERAIEQGLQVYHDVLEAIRLPVDPSELSNNHSKAETAAIKVFISTSFNDTEHNAQQKLNEEIQTLYQNRCNQNKEEWSNVCKRELNQVFSQLEAAMKNGSFMRPGGYTEYRNKLQSCTNDYKARTSKTFMSEEVLSKYLRDNEQFEKNILLADQCLNAAEQKKEAERLQKEALQRANNMLVNTTRLHEQERREQQRTYEKNVTQLLERMDKERQRAKEDNERVMEAKLREQKFLLEGGFQQRADDMNKQINSLKGEMMNSEAILTQYKEIANNMNKQIQSLRGEISSISSKSNQSSCLIL